MFPELLAPTNAVIMWDSMAAAIIKITSSCSRFFHSPNPCNVIHDGTKTVILFVIFINTLGTSSKSFKQIYSSLWIPSDEQPQNARYIILLLLDGDFYTGGIKIGACLCAYVCVFIIAALNRRHSGESLMSPSTTSWLPCDSDYANGIDRKISSGCGAQVIDIIYTVIIAHEMAEIGHHHTR